MGRLSLGKSALTPVYGVEERGYRHACAGAAPLLQGATS